MTRKQCKCQYVQEQGVIFGRWIFFFSPNWGKHSNVWETKYSMCFPFPKNAIKAERLSVYILTERKRIKQVHLGREPRVSSFHSSVLEWQWTGWMVQWVMSYWSWDLSDVLPFYSIPLPRLEYGLCMVSSAGRLPSWLPLLTLQYYKEWQQSQLLTLVRLLFLPALLPSKT